MKFLTVNGRRARKINESLAVYVDKDSTSSNLWTVTCYNIVDGYCNSYNIIASTRQKAWIKVYAKFV